MTQDSGNIVLTAQQIQERVAELGEQLTRDYSDTEPVFVAVIQGAVVFFSDLIRQVRLEILCDAVCVSSYRDGTRPASHPHLALTPRMDWRGRDVLFVDGIIDTGNTAQLLVALAKEHQARTARVCVLLDKPSRRTADVTPNYVGFQIPDLFVIGFGLDYRGKGRNFAEIRSLGVVTGAWES